MGPSFRIDFGACYLLALGMLVLPLDWLLGTIAAAVFHESCHYLAAKALNVPCHGIRIGAGGIIMELAPVKRSEELWIAAAGPAGSFLLMLFLRICPQIALCGMVQGFYNLLPVWPLDGGRITYALLPEKKLVCSVIELAAGILIFCFGIWLWRSCKMGFTPVLLAGFSLIKVFLRKIPCIEAGLGVQ